jgi:alpha-mannosidase
VLPHKGTWQDGGVVAEAAAFNGRVGWGAGLPEGTWAAVERAPGLMLDAVKRAEDADALVLRLYEAHGGRGTARVRLARPVAEAHRANLLEEPLAHAEVDGSGAIVVPFRPWEIVTLLVR